MCFVSFAQYHVCGIRSRRCLCQQRAAFHDCVVFHCMTISQFVDGFLSGFQILYRSFDTSKFFL